MTQDVLITGGSGLLALNWAAAMRDRHSVTLVLHRRAIAPTGFAAISASLESTDDLCRLLESRRPLCVIHTAGLTNVEACETNPSLAEHVNVGLAINVARACAATETPLAHISTDHLFSGTEAMVTESREPEPLNVYAGTKARAETGVLEAHGGALVIRTNFYGWGPSYRPSFSDTIIQSLRRGEPVTLFQDVFYTPILAEALAVAVHGLLRVGASGTFNVGGDERLSKYEFGHRIASEFGLDDRLITAGELAMMATRTRRPRDMSLSNAKARTVLGHPLGGVGEHLARLREQEAVGQFKEIREL